MSSRFGFVFLVALSLALACTVGFAVAPASYDDGYITYRYAQNLAAGRGLVLNPGETVLGTSAPGYALVLAGVAFVLRPFGVEVAHVGAGMFLLAMASLPVLLAGILRRLETRHPELTACMFALLAIPARWNVELMGCEQVPILALLALAFLLALSGHDLAAGAAAGIAGALRNDAGFAIAALAFALWINRRRIPVRFAVSALVPVVAVWSWLLATFGTILPVSLAGKQAEMEFVHGGYGTAELAWLLRSTSWAAAGTLGVLALAAFLPSRERRGGGGSCVSRAAQERRTFIAAAAAALLVSEVFYRFISVPFAPWYALPTFNTLLALSSVGWMRILDEATRNRPILRVGQMILATTLASAMVSSSFAFLHSTWGRPADPRIRVYRDIGAWLRSHTLPQSRVAAVEIGALAYFSDRPVLDLAGLIDPELRTARHEGRLRAAVDAERFDYLVWNSAFDGNFLAQLATSRALELDYRRVATFSRPEYPRTIQLLQRKR